MKYELTLRITRIVEVEAENREEAEIQAEQDARGDWERYPIETLKIKETE